MAILEKRVAAVMTECADYNAEIARYVFVGSARDMIERGPMQSPIEQLFFMAAETTGLANGLRVCFHSTNGEHTYPGENAYSLIPQFQVARYKLDFLLIRHGKLPDLKGGVAIECDGHAFHDKDEQQRRYEKGRDRDLQRAGLLVAHFTGAEIHANPYAAAVEALKLATGDDGMLTPKEVLGG